MKCIRPLPRGALGDDLGFGGPPARITNADSPPRVRSVVTNPAIGKPQFQFFRVFSNAGMSLDEADKGSTQWVDRWLGK